MKDMWIGKESNRVLNQFIDYSSLQSYGRPHQVMFPKISLQRPIQPTNKFREKQRKMYIYDYCDVLSDD